jgi:hypothetical protein
MAFIVVLGAGLPRVYRAGHARPLAAGGLAALAARLAAGHYENPFGDSAFLMLLLVVVTLPFAAARGGGPSSPPGP